MTPRPIDLGLFDDGEAEGDEGNVSSALRYLILFVMTVLMLVASRTLIHGL